MSWPTMLCECAKSESALHAPSAVMAPTATRSPRPTARWWAMSAPSWRIDVSSLLTYLRGPADSVAGVRETPIMEGGPVKANPTCKVLGALSMATIMGMAVLGIVMVVPSLLADLPVIALNAAVIPISAIPAVGFLLWLGRERPSPLVRAQNIVAGIWVVSFSTAVAHIVGLIPGEHPDCIRFDHRGRGRTVARLVSHRQESLPKLKRPSARGCCWSARPSRG